MKNLIFMIITCFFMLGCASFSAEYIEVAKVSDCEDIAKQKGLIYQTEHLYNKHLSYISHYKPELVCIAKENVIIGKEKDICHSKKMPNDTIKTECYKEKPLYKYVRYYKKSL